MIGWIDQIVSDAQNNCARKLCVTRNLIVKPRRSFLNLHRTRILRKPKKVKGASWTIVALAQIQAQIEAKQGQCAGGTEEIGFVDIFGVEFRSEERRVGKEC